jgi:hypothetical protein
MTTAPNRSTLQLIAEVQWQIDGRVSPGPRVPGEPATPADNQDECQYFIRGFQSIMHGSGFGRSEDLTPYGQRLMAYEPATRLHSNSRPGLHYEIGAGTFAVHATQPLRDAEEFLSMVREGMKVVLKQRGWRSDDSPFPYVRVRVLDAFREPWTHQQDLDDFLRDALGIQVALPKPIAQHLRPGYRYRPSLQLQIYMEENRELKISVDVGEMDYQMAYLLDTTVTTEDRDLIGVDAVVRAVTVSHGIIRDMFADIAAPAPR